MRGKIIVAVAGYPYGSFWDQGPGNGLALSRAIYKKFPELDAAYTTFEVVTRKGLRRSCELRLEPKDNL